MTRVAIVTGSNKGIGYGIVKGLAKAFDGHVYMTARDLKLGEVALEKLKTEVSSGEASKLRLHQLDIVDVNSINKFRDFIQKDYGGVDVLVNNAGFAYKGDSKAPFAEQAENTMRVNYTGNRDMGNTFLPLMKENGRFVNVCSFVGTVSTNKNYGEEVKKKLKSDSITQEQLDDICDLFVETAQKGTHVDHGFPNSSYGFSKAVEMVLTTIQSRAPKAKGVLVNGADPGYVDTDMSSHKGHKTVDQGAEVPLWLALLPVGATEPSGKLITDGNKEMVW